MKEDNRMNRLTLFSVGRPQTKINFNRSILNGFNAVDIQHFINRGILNKSHIQQDKIYFWGCKYSKYYENKIRKLSQGDIIAFSERKEFIAKGKIVTILENKDLSKFLWGDEQFSYILVIKDVERISIPYSVLFNDIGYNCKAKINGLVLVDSNRLERLEDKHRSVDTYFQKYIV